MMQKVPENLASLADPGSTFSLSWDTVEGAEIQSWHLVLCDYPLSPRNGAGLLSGGLDLMVTRWELHPSCSSVLEDTGVRGKHYVVLGLDPGGQVHFPPGFALDEQRRGQPLSGLPSTAGWVKGVKKRDKYSGMF